MLLMQGSADVRGTLATIFSIFRAGFAPFGVLSKGPGPVLSNDLAQGYGATDS